MSLPTIQGGPERMQHLRSIISRKQGTELKSWVHYCVYISFSSKMTPRSLILMKAFWFYGSFSEETSFSRFALLSQKSQFTYRKLSIVWLPRVKCLLLLCIMPSLHLLRSSYDGLVYDFPCDLGGIVSGYGLRLLCLHYLRSSCDFMYLGIVYVEGPKTKPYRGCTEIVQRLCDDRADIIRSYDFCTMLFCSPVGKKIVRSLHDQRKASARWPCARTIPPTMCLRATILRFWKICILRAKQNRRGYGDRESVRNRTIVVCHPREIVRLEGYDQFTVTLRWS